MIIPLLAMAGSLARKVTCPRRAGTSATDFPTFAFLTGHRGFESLARFEYFPAMARGRSWNISQMMAGKLF